MPLRRVHKSIPVPQARQFIDELKTLSCRQDIYALVCEFVPLIQQSQEGFINGIDFDLWHELIERAHQRKNTFNNHP